MQLSLCLITRNEQDNLPRALDSFGGLCDEIVIADTGSTDRTIEIARSYGANVVSFPWCDDFSAARNHCLKHARGEWIFWLDADEELLVPSKPLVRSCMDCSTAAGWFVLRQDLVRGDRMDLFTEMWQLRLFRRHEDLNFVGRCHPQFNPRLTELAGQRGMSVMPSSIRMRHWGYLAEVKPAKLQRAAKLLKLELTDRPGQLYYQIEYGRTLAMLGQQAEATQALTEATANLLRNRNDPNPPTTMAAALLEYWLVSPGDTSAVISQDQLFELSNRWFPRCAPLIWAMSKRRFDAGDFEGAAQQLESLVQIAREDSYDRSISFNPRLIGEDALLNLAVCYIRLADLDRAEKILQSLLPTPRRVEAEQNIAVIRQLRAAAEEYSEHDADAAS